MKAYCNIIDSKVMLSKLRKPELSSYADEPEELNEKAIWEYEFDMKEFNDSIIGEAENIQLKKGNPGICYISYPIVGVWYPTYKLENQPCEVKPSGDKYIIISI